jgi:cytochrome c oxidase assembly protein subunit 15
MLLLAGGLVTSRDAGLAVPDWPLSFGTLNPPRWYAIENVRTEHGHRLIAGVVALLTIVVAWRVRSSERRTAVRRLAAVAVAAVLAQALLGGLRVLHLSIDLAMVHAGLAQIFFCLVVSLAVLTSPHWEEQQGRRAPARFATAAFATVLLVVLQLVVGILIRHAGASARPLMGNWLFYLHGAGALCVLFASFRMRAEAERESMSSYLAKRARLLTTLTAVQIALGVAAWITTEAATADRSASALESWIPTFHVAVGASVLACSVTLALHALAARSVTADAHVAMRTAAAPR